MPLGRMQSGHQRGLTWDYIMNRFQQIMSAALVVLFGVSAFGVRLTRFQIAGIGQVLLSVALIFVILLPLPAYCHQKEQWERRDAVLVLYWAVLASELLPYPVLTAARLRMPIRDATFARIDGLLGVDVPTLMKWTQASEPLYELSSASYLAILPVLVLAIVLPAFIGRKLEAQRFLLSNLIAYALAVPLFSLFPAVGPWAAYHFAPTAQQSQCENMLLGLRLQGLYLYRVGTDISIISFPSFHVIWALLSARTLWSFPWLRAPVALVTPLIVLSTMTTGWHYFSDVLGGLTISLMAMTVAGLILPATTSAVPIPNCSIVVSRSRVC